MQHGSKQHQGQVKTGKSQSMVVALLAISLWGLCFSACRPELEEEDWDVLHAMGPLEIDMLPSSPTNAYADDEVAAVLGHELFFDERMSSDGEISCASCHDPSNNFAGREAISPGAYGRLGDRHTPTLMNIGMQTFFFWDGRTDSLWSTPLQAIEANVEGDFTRLEVAHHIQAHYADQYEQVFGALPRLSHLPEKGKPGDEAWEEMDDVDKANVNTIFANVGKSLEAYQRKLVCVDTKFDRVLRGEDDFSRSEEAGAAMFVRSDLGNCVACHSGANFSDGEFHNLQIGGNDVGRSKGVGSLLGNPFKSTGEFSDDTTAFSDRLDALDPENDSQVGQFKTPTLRGVAQRGRLGHDGSSRNLERWLDEVYDDDRRRRRRGPGSLDPEARDLEFNEGDMMSFLRTLNCPPLDSALLEPPPGKLPAFSEPGLSKSIYPSVTSWECSSKSNHHLETHSSRSIVRYSNPSKPFHRWTLHKKPWPPDLSGEDNKQSR